MSHRGGENITLRGRPIQKTGTENYIIRDTHEDISETKDGCQVGVGIPCRGRVSAKETDALGLKMRRLQRSCR